jgi:hypothetical protein
MVFRPSDTEYWGRFAVASADCRLLNPVKLPNLASVPSTVLGILVDIPGSGFAPHSRTPLRANMPESAAMGKAAVLGQVCLQPGPAPAEGGR